MKTIARHAIPSKIEFWKFLNVHAKTDISTPVFPIAANAIKCAKPVLEAILTNVKVVSMKIIL